MVIDRLILIIAGGFILASLALSQLHDPRWLYFTAFVGANMLQAGFTRWCLMAKILRMFGAGPGKAFD